MFPCRQQGLLPRLFIASVLAALALVARPQRAGAKELPLCSEDSKYDFNSPSPFKVILVTDESLMSALSLDATRNPRVVQRSKRLPLHIVLGRRWELQEPTRCRFDFASFWKSKGAPEPQAIGLTNGQIPREVMRALLHLDDQDEQGELQLVVAEGIAKAGVVACPKDAKAIAWSTDQDLDLPPSNVKRPLRLMVVLDAQRQECAAIADLKHDAQRLSIRLSLGPQDELTVSYDAYSLAQFPQLEVATPAFEDPRLDCSAAVEGRGGSLSVGCGTQLLVGKRRLFLGHNQQQFALRVLSVDPAGHQCPVEAPDATSSVSVLGDTAFACLYRNGSLLAQPPLVGNYEVVPVWHSAGLRIRARAPNAVAQPWEIDLTEGEGEAALQLSSTTSAGSLLLQPIRITRSSLRHDDDRVLVRRRRGIEQALCIPAFADVDADLQRQLVAHTELDSTLSGWHVRENQLCPDARGLPDINRDLDAPLEVTYYLGERRFFTRTLVSGDSVRRAAIQILSGVESPTTRTRNFSRTGFFEKELVTGEEKAWLCLDTSDEALANEPELEVASSNFEFREETNATHDPTDSDRLSVRLTRAGGEPTYGDFTVRLSRQPPPQEEAFKADPHRARYCTALGRPVPGSPQRLVLEHVSFEEPGAALVAKTDCGYPDCIQRLDRSAAFGGWNFGISLTGAALYGADGRARAAVRADLSLWQAGFRLSPRWSFLWANVGIEAAPISAYLGSPPHYDDDEARRQSGRCVAGCEDVQKIAATVQFGVYYSPCVRFEVIPLILSVPLCAGGTLDAIIDVREGAGVYQRADGSVYKVGERGDGHWRLLPLLHADLGIALTVPGY